MFPEPAPTTCADRIVCPAEHTAAGAYDFYAAAYSSVHGWGGGLSFAVGLTEGLRAIGATGLVLGVEPEERGNGAVLRQTKSADAPRLAEDTPPAAAPPRMNVPTRTPPHLWRVRSWCLPRALAQSLAALPPPRHAFLAVSPIWVLAARRTWPTTPVIFVFPCLLANCLPFTWPRRRPTFWQRVNYLGTCRTERAALLAADHTLVPTWQSVEELRQFAPRAADRLVRCDFGVRAPRIDPALRARQRAALGVDRDAFLIAAIGTCDRNKAFDVAVRALANVHPRGRLLMIGHGAERPALEKLAADWGVAGRVTFTGPQHDMAPWYGAADCVLSTSFYDTFPNVLLEAMATGRPIVAPAHDPPHAYAGIAEVIEEHGCGLRYRQGDADGLAGVLNRLMDHPAERQRLGTAGQQAAAQRYRWARTAEVIRALLRSCPRG